MISYAHAVLRFWWIVALGAVLAVLAMVMVSRSGVQSYTSVSEVLVTSPQAPYVRISVTDGSGAAPTTTTPGRGGRTTTTPLATTSAPDVNTLVRAANLYPFLIESDLVARQRDAMFGELEGVVSARAIFAVANALRFDPSEIPIIQIAGVAGTPSDSVKLTQSTTDAFRAWIKDSQDEAGLAPRERIVIEQIKRPTEIFVAGGTSTSLVLLVGAAILLAFAAFAVVLDRSLTAAAASESGAAAGDADVARRKTVELPAAVGQDASQAGTGASTDDAAESADAAQERKGRKWA
jgi:hypothetical protein